MENRKVIIVGAGIGGLACAYWLLQRSYDVEILESSERPGGRMATLERNGDRIDVGAQFYHSNYRYAFDLIDAMGLSGTKRQVKGKTQYVLADGSTHLYSPQIPYMKLLGLQGNLKLYWFILKYIVFGRPFPHYRITEDIPEYDNVESVDLYRSPGDRLLRKYMLEVVSAGMSHGRPEWLSLYQYIRDLRLISFTNYIGLAGGVASLTDELAKSLPVQYGSPVRQLVMEKGRIVGVQMENDGSVKKAGHVIVAVDAASAAHLMPDELEEQRRFFASVIYSPSPMPVFFLDRPLRKDVWCYINDPELKRKFMFAIDGSAKVPEMVPSGKSVVTGWSGHPMTMDLIDRPDDEIIEESQTDIELMIPGFSKWIEEATVYRIPFATERYPVGAHRQVLDFLEQARRMRGVSFVSSLFGATCIEASLVSAAEAVRRVCGWGGTA